MQILVPSRPQRLKITETMICDFITDPVMFVHVMFNDVPTSSPTRRGGRRLVLDVFQKSRFRIKCLIPDVIDSSGFGTGKSLEDWLVAQWEACVLAGFTSERKIWVYYQTFETGKAIFWPYYQQFNARSAPLFAAQLGKLDASGDFDGKDNTKGPACYLQHYQEGGLVALPAPGWFQSAKSQAGLTFHRAIVDEWTKVETMTPTKDRVRTEGGDPVSGIDQQIVGRVRAQSFNQFNPILGTHRLYTATAESPNHPSYRRVKIFLKQIAQGNPNYSVISYNFKHFSNLPAHTGKSFRDQVPNWQTIKTMKEQLSRSHYLREVLGIWQRETTGFYSEEALNGCVAAGIANNTQPEIGRVEPPQPATLNPQPCYYFSGWDPAPAQSKRADDGAGATIKLTLKPGLAPSGNPGDWKFEAVWAYRIRGLQKYIAPGEPDRGMYLAETARKWAGFMHLKHQHFGFNGIMLDPQAGGQGPSIIPELNKTRQLLRGVEEDCLPIAQLDEALGNALYILCLFKRRDVGVQSLWTMLLGDDNLIDAAHGKMQEMVDRAELLFPKPFNERPRAETAAWPVEQQWALKNLDAARVQLRNIEVATNDNGTWRLTGNGAKQFSARGKKDIAYALIMALVRALTWLKMNAEMGDFGDSSDTGGVHSF